MSPQMGGPCGFLKLSGSSSGGLFFGPFFFQLVWLVLMILFQF